MGTLNELIQKWQSLEQIIIDANGCLTPELENEIAANEEAIGYKLDGYADFIAYLKGQIEYLKEQEMRFLQRRKTIENAVDALREKMVFAMQATGETKIKTASHSYSIRVTESWKLKDEISENEKQKLVKEGLGKFEFKADMKAIKEAFNGTETDWLIVIPKTSITIR